MRAAGRALLCVVHRSIHTHFRDGFRGWSGNRLADGKVYRRAALHWNGAEGAGAADTRVIHTRAEATMLVLLPLNRFLASTPFSK